MTSQQRLTLLFPLILAGAILALWAPLAPQAIAQAASAHPGVSSTSTDPFPRRPVILPKIDCAALASLDFATGDEAPAIVQSASVEAATADRAEFCLVKGRVAPQVGFELRLPTRTYTGRYLQGGCGGNCGFIGNDLSPSCSTARAYEGAFAIGFNDAGHSTDAPLDTLWARNAGLREDFGHRGVHVAALAAKAIISAYYGEAPDYSYFMGCSNGGREGLMEAQRYPDDFDGIVAGAANYAVMEKVERYLWEATHGDDANGRQLFGEAQARLLHEAVMAECDGIDGLVDGQIDDPRACHFDPRTLHCASTVRGTPCLDTPLVEAAIAFYRGPHTPDGRALYMGGQPYGAELTWGSSGAFSNAGLRASAGFLRDMLPPEAAIRDFTPPDWSFDEAGLRRLQAGAPIYDAKNPDLSAFRERGGKLIMWQGAQDPAAGSWAIYDYYGALIEHAGGIETTRAFARVFVIPGMYHCRGGTVPYDFDLLGPVVRWVENAQAPHSIEVTAPLDTGIMRTRPVYAWPYQARYSGTGDINDAASFEGAIPDDPIALRFDWLGAD